MKNKIVILGSKGFVAEETTKVLKQKNKVVNVSKEDIDLVSDNSAQQLSNIVNNGDTVVFISAIAPTKTIEMFEDNIRIVRNTIKSLETKKVSHMVNISSDAVYQDSESLMDENSMCMQNSYHGAMHLSREVLLNIAFGNVITHVRPTLIYGKLDPHNGYGPNSFQRLVGKNKDITLFGNGEEQRDHVFIEDVANLIGLIVQNRSFGVYNAVSGKVKSFYDIAKLVKENNKSDIEIISTERKSPMPHNGYRAFKKSKAEVDFNYKFTQLEEGLLKLI